jgi:hypothetical protein
MLATIQLVSATVALEAIDGGALEESVIQSRVSAEWPEFAAKILDEKQNSTLFWNSQQTWNAQLTRI